MLVTIQFVVDMPMELAESVKDLIVFRPQNFVDREEVTLVQIKIEEDTCTSSPKSI